MQPFLLKPDAKTSGRRGLTEEYTAEEKTPIALQIAVAAHPDYSEFRVSLTDVKIHQVSQTKNGDKLAGKFQNNTYYAEGGAKFWFRHQAKDMVLEPKYFDWHLEFTDSLEPSLGTPDLKVLKFYTVE